MNDKVTRSDQDLLLRFLHGDTDPAVTEALSERASTNPELAQCIADELLFSESIRQALAEDAKSPDRATHIEAAWKGALESATLSSDEWMARVIDGSASAYECDQLTKQLWEAPAAARDLRHRLAENEWLRIALSEQRSEQAFLESLQTRMWAETEEDRFVDNFAKLLEKEAEQNEAEEAENIVPFPRSWMSTGLRLLAAAAAVAVGAFVAGQFAANRLSPQSAQSSLANAASSLPLVASVVKSSTDASWSGDRAPNAEGKLTPGTYELKTGVVSMQLSRGGDLTVQGPAKFQIGFNATAEVLTGIALARAPESDSGVQIRSRGLSITEPAAHLIGIDARAEESTEAIVLGGGAGICLADSGKCRDLSEFEAVKVDHFRDRLVDVPYNPRAFSKAWAMLAGVENNLGPVRIELPGSLISAAGATEGEVRVFVENESFRSDSNLEVDHVVAGEFSVATVNPGESLAHQGELRSYLLQMTPSDRKDAEGDGLETSLTFDHPIVGVIFSQDRLEGSDATIGASFSQEEGWVGRGLSSGEDEILLSEDRRTINLRLRGNGEGLERVRVLVALN